MVETAVRQAQVPEPAMRGRDELAIAFFGTWMLIGLYLDGWAHEADKPETFFTPWHGVLYSGFAAAVAFFVLAGFRDRRRGISAPVDRLASVGLVIFIAAALGDGVWHEIFGIEVDIEALLSPTHLALMIGGTLMLGAPIRSAITRDERTPSFRVFAPTLVTIGLVAALASFFLLYLSAFHVELPPFMTPSEIGDDLPVIWGIAAILTSNVLLMGAAMFVLKYWTPPAGAFTLLFTGVAAMQTGLHAYREGVFIVPALVGGIVADALAKRPRTFSIVVPLAMWGTWFAVEAFVYGLGWTPELWLGTITLSCLAGAGLRVLALGVAPRPGERAASGDR